MSNLRQFIGAQKGTYTKGAYYPTMPPGILLDAAGAANKDGRIFLSPFEVKKAHSFTGYRFRVRTTGGNIRIGIFPDTAADGAFGAAVIAATDTGSVAVGSNTTNQTISATIALTPGWYWCGYQLSNSAAVLDGKTMSNDCNALIGFDEVNNMNGTWPQITQAFGVFPATLGALDATPWVLTSWPIFLIGG